MIWPSRKLAVVADTGNTAPDATAPVRAAKQDKNAAPDTTRLDRMTELKVDLHQKLIERINLAALETMSRDQVGREAAVAGVARRRLGDFPNGARPDVGWSVRLRLLIRREQALLDLRREQTRPCWRCSRRLWSGRPPGSSPWPGATP